MSRYSSSQSHTGLFLLVGAGLAAAYVLTTRGREGEARVGAWPFGHRGRGGREGRGRHRAFPGRHEPVRWGRGHELHGHIPEMGRRHWEQHRGAMPYPMAAEQQYSAPPSFGGDEQQYYAQPADQSEQYYASPGDQTQQYVPQYAEPSDDQAQIPMQPPPGGGGGGPSYPVAPHPAFAHPHHHHHHHHPHSPAATLPAPGGGDHAQAQAPIAVAPQPRQGGGGQPAVQTMQRLLNVHAGQKIVDEDGKIGPGTIKAVKQFQDQNNLPKTGTFDAATATHLAHHASGMGVQILPPPSSSAPSDHAASSSQDQTANGQGAGSGDLPLSPWWTSPPLLADKQGMSQANRDALGTLSQDVQNSIAHQSLMTNHSMEDIMNAMHGGG